MESTSEMIKSFIDKIVQLDERFVKNLQFESTVLGFKFALLTRPLLKNRIVSRVLRRKLVEARFQDNLRILLRYTTADLAILKDIYVENIYEKHYHLHQGDVVFDIGSHIGIFTLKASRLVEPNGFVYAFEPEPENFMLLKRNVALNKATNIRIFKKAVSSSSRILHLYVDAANTGAHSVQCATGQTRLLTRSILVSSVTLDQIMQKFDVKEVDLLKIDVEGHELEVLKGANWFLTICKHIAMETHEGENNAPSNVQIIENLEKHGFAIKQSGSMLYGWK